MRCSKHVTGVMFWAWGQHNYNLRMLLSGALDVANVKYHVNVVVASTPALCTCCGQQGTIAGAARYGEEKKRGQETRLRDESPLASASLDGSVGCPSGTVFD